MIREFEHATFGKVRATFVDGEPCLHLSDLTKLFKIENASQIRSKLEKDSTKLVEVPSERGTTNNFFVSISQLSVFFFQSRAREATQIGDWIYRDILPQLTTYSLYQIQDLKDPKKAVEFLELFEDLKIRAHVLETELKINAPKVKAINELLGSGNCVDLDSVHEVIRFKSVSKEILFKILRATHVLDERNIPFQDFCDKKFFRVVESQTTACGKTYISLRTFVYRSGIAFIERILKEYDGRKLRKEK